MKILQGLGGSNSVFRCPGRDSLWLEHVLHQGDATSRYFLANPMFAVVRKVTKSCVAPDNNRYVINKPCIVFTSCVPHAHRTLAPCGLDARRLRTTEHLRLAFFRGLSSPSINTRCYPLPWFDSPSRRLINAACLHHTRGTRNAEALDLLDEGDSKHSWRCVVLAGGGRAGNNCEKRASQPPALVRLHSYYCSTVIAVQTNPTLHCFYELCVPHAHCTPAPSGLDADAACVRLNTWDLQFSSRAVVFLPINTLLIMRCFHLPRFEGSSETIAACLHMRGSRNAQALDQLDEGESKHSWRRVVLTDGGRAGNESKKRHLNTCPGTAIQLL